MKKAAFYTLGCKVNQYETEAMAELFADSGYEIKEFTEVADVYVINTCSVTNMGDRKSRQIIRRAKKLNPNAVIAVTGCYAQTAPDEVLAIEGVNLVLGTKDRKNIVTLVEELNTESNINHVSDIMSNHEFEELQTEPVHLLKFKRAAISFVLTALSPMPEVLFAAEQKMML